MKPEKEFEELLKAIPPFKKRPKKPEPKPEPKIVSLASSNPDVPLERQRERLTEAQRRLVEDEDRRLEEWKAQKRHERWLMERQAAIDFWMEQKLANEEAERRLDKELDPFDIGIYSARPFHRGE
jgi:hypothetical protein